MLRVGFVGLGDIGEPMARRLIQAGFPVTLWARRAASLEPFAGSAFSAAADLAELGRSSDVVGVCVFSDADVHGVVLGAHGILAGMTSGGIILVHSTVSVESVLDLQQQCATKGVTVLDVPVSGFRERAESGQLTVMVGGPADAVATVRPVLAAFGSHVLHLGPIGSGLKMKALNQALLLANVNAAALALEAGRNLGLDRAATEATLRSATGGSFGLDVLVSRTLVDPAFAILGAKIAEKDLAVFVSICAAAGIDASELVGLAAASAVSVPRIASPAG